MTWFYKIVMKQIVMMIDIIMHIKMTGTKDNDLPMLIFIALTKLYIIWFCYVKEVKDRPAEISCFCSRIILFPTFKGVSDMAYNIFTLTDIFLI